MMKTGDQATRPPRAAEWLLSRMTELERFQPLGDLEEEFNSVLKDDGRARARRFYWRQVLIALPSYLGMLLDSSLSMLRNYLAVSLRVMRRNRGFSAINIIGLAIGMACCALILLWVRDEVSYDRFHRNSDRIYRVVFDRDMDGIRYSTGSSPAPLAEALKRDFSEVEGATMMGIPGGVTLKVGDKSFNERWMMFVDPDFFEMFSFRLLRGESSSVLSDPFSIVLTRSASERFFGDSDPIGKRVMLNDRLEFTVSGVLEDLPGNSSIEAEVLAPFPTFAREMLPPDTMDNWSRHSHDSFVMLRPGTDVDAFNERFVHYKARYDSSTVLTSRLQPLGDLHLHSAGISASFRKRGDIKYVYLFSALAVVVLLIACMNFMNLATARSTGRAREVGTRKVVGARGGDIMSQFFCETIVLSVVALVLAVPLVYLALPGFNMMSGKDLSISLPADFDLLGGMALLALLTGIVSGSYPSLVLSRFSPAGILRGGRARHGSSHRFGSVLVVSQFAVSIILITTTIVLTRQLDFMLEKDPGFDRDGIMTVTLPDGVRDRYDIIKDEFARIGGVKGVTGSYSPMSWMYTAMSGLDWEGRNEDQPDIEFWIEWVDRDFLETMGIDLAAGRGYSDDFAGDERSYLLNEEAVRRMGVESPVGMRFTLDSEHPGRVIGVVKDYNFRSLHNPIEPLVLCYDPSRFNFIHIKTSSLEAPRVAEQAKAVWEKINSGLPFRYWFLEWELGRVYGNEKRIGQIFRWAAAFGVFISCLGLIGLASFVVERRTREIGIRKVLGASEAGILTMITGGLVKWVLAANLIAWPVAWYLLDRYLRTYAYRVDVGWYVYALSGFAALAVAVATVSWQAFRASRANPVKSLRSE